jgi:hypothetical protein
LIDALANSLFSLSPFLPGVKGLVEELAAIHNPSRHTRSGFYRAIGLAYDTLVPIKAGHLAVKSRADLGGLSLKLVWRNELVSLREQFAPI